MTKDGIDGLTLGSLDWLNISTGEANSLSFLLHFRFDTSLFTHCI